MRELSLNQLEYVKIVGKKLTAVIINFLVDIVMHICTVLSCDSHLQSQKKMLVRYTLDGKTYHCTITLGVLPSHMSVGFLNYLQDAWSVRWLEMLRSSWIKELSFK